MNMKLVSIFLCLFFCASVNGQDFIRKKRLADHYYERFDYSKAVPMYEQLLVSHPHDYALYEKLADCYRRINDSRNAERCYAVLMDSSYVSPENKLHYAQALARNGKYELSLSWYEKYSADKPGDAMGPAFVKAYRSVGQFYADSNAYSVRKAGFNSPESDFSPVYFKNGIVFVSARHDFSLIRFWYNWTSSPYLDLYYAADSSGVSDFSHSINSVYHEGPVTFSPTRDTIIFTRSNYYHSRFRKSSEGINKLKLYQAHLDKRTKKWIEITPMPFNSDQYSAGHPAFADNGHTLFFASDMPGGFGGTDIYFSKQTTDPSGHCAWGTPVNLGPKINSAGNELFPYVDEQNNLWFSSTGIPGLGGLDIFVSTRNRDEFSIPRNAGAPLNSRFDDFGIITRNGGLEGMFSSDRNAGDDIYTFNRSNMVLKGVVRDSADHEDLLENATVCLVLPDGTIAGTQKTDVNGRFQFPLDNGREYSVKTGVAGYLPGVKKISIPGIPAAVIQEYIDLTREKSILLFGRITDKNTGGELGGVEVKITDVKENKVVLDTVTSVDGNFRKKLTTARISDKLEYRVNLSKSGYLAKNFSFSYVIAGSEINMNNFLDARLDKIEMGTDIGKLLDLNPIYFDLAKWSIRPDAAVELDKVVKAMKDNPCLVIELGSHTDARGSSQSNLVLSDKRARASVAYIISKGIDENRIHGKGYGETQLLNKCTDGVDCTEEEHARNRRTEFKIVRL
jgi:outer membrane protein OmpA-like peptidoglycan-associated protein